jgi:hypothetical protein
LSVIHAYFSKFEKYVDIRKSGELVLQEHNLKMILPGWNCDEERYSPDGISRIFLEI